MVDENYGNFTTFTPNVDFYDPDHPKIPQRTEKRKRKGEQEREKNKDKQQSFVFTLWSLVLERQKRQKNTPTRILRATWFSKSS